MDELSKNDLINYRIARARETLNEVHSMVEGGYWNGAVNRLYYACYYSVSAVLLKYDLQAHSHTGVRQMFGLHLVQTKKISRDLAKFYTDIFDKRQTGDYDDFISYNKETLDELIPLATQLIEQLELIINTKEA
ncbi:MAG: HEPN domain-containing protein [Bacteroidia bacterium]